MILKKYRWILKPLLYKIINLIESRMEIYLIIATIVCFHDVIGNGAAASHRAHVAASSRFWRIRCRAATPVRSARTCYFRSAPRVDAILSRSNFFSFWRSSRWSLIGWGFYTDGVVFLSALCVWRFLFIEVLRKTRRRKLHKSHFS